MKQFANDFHEWKSLANRFMSDEQNDYSWWAIHYFIFHMLFHALKTQTHWKQRLIAHSTIITKIYAGLG